MAVGPSPQWLATSIRLLQKQMDTLGSRPLAEPRRICQLRLDELIPPCMVRPPGVFSKAVALEVFDANFSQIFKKTTHMPHVDSEDVFFLDNNLLQIPMKSMHIDEQHEHGDDVTHAIDVETNAIDVDPSNFSAHNFSQISKKTMLVPHEYGDVVTHAIDVDPSDFILRQHDYGDVETHAIVANTSDRSPCNLIARGDDGANYEYDDVDTHVNLDDGEKYEYGDVVTQAIDANDTMTAEISTMRLDIDDIHEALKNLGSWKEDVANTLLQMQETVAISNDEEVFSSKQMLVLADITANITRTCTGEVLQAILEKVMDVMNERNVDFKGYVDAAVARLVKKIESDYEDLFRRWMDLREDLREHSHSESYEMYSNQWKGNERLND